MKCYFCSNSKVYEVTEIVNGEVKSIPLCASCFQTYVENPQNTIGEIKTDSKVDVNPKINVNPTEADKFVQDIMDLVEELVSESSKQLIGTPTKQQTISQKKCKKCGLTLDDLVKMGKLGCGNCYDVYQNELTNVLYVSHGTPNDLRELRHKGKISKSHKEHEEKETDQMLLTKLRYKLQLAIERENYEDAAKLRDLIKEVTLNSPPISKSDLDQ